MTQQSVLGQIVERRTYLRPTDAQGAVFETPEQAWRRVIDHQHWLWERAKGEPLDLIELAELEELYQLFIDRKATVSGRTRWLGGTDIAKTREASQFNPLPRDAKFISDTGVKTFEECESGDKFNVLTHYGEWKPATVINVGERDILEIALIRGRGKKTIRSSIDHTWILRDDTRVLATDLKPGDQLYAAPEDSFYDWSYEDAPVDEQYYWAYGFVYGDGTVSVSGGSETSRVRLCGTKADHLDRFTALGFGHSYPPSCDGDPFVWTGKYLKTLPDEGTDIRLIKAFLHGYFAADANKKWQRGETRFSGIFCGDAEAADFVATYAPVFGLYIVSETEEDVETNYGRRRGIKFNFTTSTKQLLWKVAAVRNAPAEDCWCLTVDDAAHSFVMPDSIVSGNCAFGQVQTVHDVVDTIWLLLQGCGVGFAANIGVLNGFVERIDDVEIIRSTKTLPKDSNGNPISDPSVKGNPDNVETFDKKTGVWTIKVGDSAEAWAKLFGKLLAFKHHAKKLVLDLSEIRPAGYRLSGYGWISSGDSQLSEALNGIVAVLNRSAGQLLNAIDMLDIENWLGTILSSRRSAEIALYSYGEPEWEAFALAKSGIKDGENWHRSMSNNSLLFYHKPTKRELNKIFKMIQKGGGSEPGFINAIAAMKRAPYFKGVNPCAEILLGDKSFCNLVEIAVSRFNGDEDGLHRATWLVARANYRQTCVNLDDGILQRTWHELNEFLRLCGVGLTGIVGWEYHKDADALKDLRNVARSGAFGMADELGTPRPQLVTTVKPSGTQSKVFGLVGDEIASGAHVPLGRYLMVRVIVPSDDPLLKAVEAAGYRTEPVPNNDTSRIVVIPVEYNNIDFDKVDVDGTMVEVNQESAVDQLDRYKLLQDNYVDHNCSITIYYSPDEVPEIVDWLAENWDSYVGVSFLYRPDPVAMVRDPKAVAKQLGYPYLPQTPVTAEVFHEYADTLGEVDFTGTDHEEMIEADFECAGGACPIR